MNKNQGTFRADVELQSWLRPACTEVLFNKDYARFRALIEKLDGLLCDSHLEMMAVEFALEGFEEASGHQRRVRAQFGLKALRFEVLRMILSNLSFRQLSCRIAGSDLLADFCGVRRLLGIRGTSKSTLERASKFFRADQVRQMHRVLCEMIGEEDRAEQLGLSEPLDLSVCLVDSTCLEANIHFPVDWVLLRDVTRTLIKAMKLIRDEGLVHRMPFGPQHFAREMNRLCIEMTHSSRRHDGRRRRKRILRSMKKLLVRIGEHARRHAGLLESGYQQTRFSLAQARQIISRIENMLEQLPLVIRQAHERLIGERLVASADKILSVYEPQVGVIVRRKAGKEVEFGNTLFVCETPSGLISDWELYPDKPPPEWRQMLESLDRQERFDLSNPICEVVGDRGFCSKRASAQLKDREIFDALCPRDPIQLTERMNQPRFKALQKRRGSTEARIAIIKQRQAKRLRCRGFTHRYLAVAWGILGHNLWLIAKLLAQEERSALAA